MNPKNKMHTITAEIAAIRASLGLRRLSPRRLYLVDDGAYSWIGDRAQLTAKTARILSDIAGSSEEDYAAACRTCKNLASSCGSGAVDFFALPEDWRDGSALGPISPL